VPTVEMTWAPTATASPKRGAADDKTTNVIIGVSESTTTSVIAARRAKGNACVCVCCVCAVCVCVCCVCVCCVCVCAVCVCVCAVCMCVCACVRAQLTSAQRVPQPRPAALRRPGESGMLRSEASVGAVRRRCRCEQVGGESVVVSRCVQSDIVDVSKHRR
jgi:hypothetical protein